MSLGSYTRVPENDAENVIENVLRIDLDIDPEIVLKNIVTIRTFLGSFFRMRVCDPKLALRPLASLSTLVAFGIP